jgi:hypothetical protein
MQRYNFSQSSVGSTNVGTNAVGYNHVSVSSGAFLGNGDIYTPRAQSPGNNFLILDYTYLTAGHILITPAYQVLFFFCVR